MRILIIKRRNTSFNKKNAVSNAFKKFQNSPVLYNNRFFHIVNFGIFSALNAMIIIWIFSYYLYSRGIEPGSIIHWMLPLSVLFVWAGARIMHLISLGKEFFKAPFRSLLQTGFYMQGGVVEAIVWSIIFSSVTGIPLSLVWDGLALGALLGQVVGRIGCFNYGCCYGKPSASPWGTAYTNPQSKILRINPALKGVPVHPAQLYKAFLNLVMFLLIVLLFPLPFGTISIIFLVYHGLSRMVFEYFRSDLFQNLKRQWLSLKFALLSVVAGFLLIIAGPLLDNNFYRVELTTEPMNLFSFYNFLVANPLMLGIGLSIGFLTFLGYGIHGHNLGTFQFTTRRRHENNDPNCRRRSLRR
ncbi:prolipoprotein diacylglyceryl transferase [Planococcus antarcticus]|uniref:prolipoprotein diacylglyceryl transferase n=1 Tax=Planococcus antarcticus TaxID=161360 RepID=UPI0009F5F9E2|nr:prolipoprotein diacylglyceryl transferase family protein [Planococcus antarcticus]